VAVGLAALRQTCRAVWKRLALMVAVG
jgi:hypothetical protein